MIAEVQNQKGVLAVVNAEIEEAKGSLSNISNITADKEQYLGEIMEKAELNHQKKKSESSEEVEENRDQLEVSSRTGGKSY